MSARGCVALAMLTAIGAVACSGRHWTKPGATVEDFNRDNHACALEAQRGVYNYATYPVNKHTYHRCMRARGYRVVEGGQWVGLRDDL